MDDYPMTMIGLVDWLRRERLFFVFFLLFFLPFGGFCIHCMYFGQMLIICSLILPITKKKIIIMDR